MLAVLSVLLIAAPARPPATPLAFAELFTPTSRELRPSDKLRALVGQRVELTGFMAKMELPPRGGFWLTPAPVVCDEAGAGTGDLPPHALFVVVRSHEGRAVPWAPRALRVTGVLEVGHRVEPDGGTTHVRLILDRLPDPAGRPARPPLHRSTSRTSTH